ncbi:MAG: NADH-quinone oxidoreductase subunit C [Candidatus Aramenus sp.]|jgi:NADH-quinone oxidoreductase subunit C|nr:NADH-quinone oxidoreductase subunit C [Candidatus Aramenus sp.]
MQRPIDNVLNLVKSKFNAQVKADSDTRGQIEVDKKVVVEVAKLLKEQGFDHVKSVTGIDFPEEEKIQVVYHVSSYSNPELARVILALKTYVTYKELKMQSLYEVWESAWTGERETYEMLGVYFEGHPDMRRLFLPEDFEGVYPLRKSYKIKLEGLFVDKQA